MKTPLPTALLLSLPVLILLSIDASSQEKDCPNQPLVTILSEDSSAAIPICNSAEKALSILAGYGLVPLRQIVIKITEEEITSHGYSAYGAYDGRKDTISLMSYQSILRQHEPPEMYGEFFDPVHYSGAIAHEITHAVFHHHSPNVSPGTAHQEYLAHAIQLAVLPEARRNGIITRMDVSSWESGDAISDIYMALEPGRFAVKSYLHLTTSENPRAFIEILLHSKWFYVYVP
jgi:hypothetical protein